MIISKREIATLSKNIRRIIDGQAVDLRDNREGKLSILKNDIHTLAGRLLEQAQQLEREKEALRQTLADISHQVKTPLTSMALLVDLLADAPPQKQAELIAGLRMSLSRTEWLAAALLKLAKLESATVVFSPEPIAASALIERAMKPLKILLDIRGQTVTLTGDAPLFCDGRWTAEALTNLIKNAAEHSPEGGEIAISAGENPLCGWICVQDAGQGIARADRAKLFRRFEMPQSEHGYGIGLPLALAIVREQNGDIEVESEEGRGAAFTMKLYKGRES
jgi:signal transduction histidine kinase